jgi:hypothetical protein
VLLRIAAVNIGRTQTALGAFYRRLAARSGKAKAVTATARKLAILFYNALRFGMTYADPGASYYEEPYRQRVLDNLRRRAQYLGFSLVAAPEAAEASDVVGVAHAAHRRPDAGLLTPDAEGDRGVLPGFKWWSQHRLSEPISEPVRAPLLAFSSRGSFEAWC